MSDIRKLELLAPAKNLGYGIAAVDHGADAVYIGAPRFGARSAAGNSMDDIGRLTEYAHGFGAKVYMALNTVLFDDELAEAEAIAVEAWEKGVDALIVQDMALAVMNLPPIPLHASTQTFNITPEKARFLEGAGFSRIILERALSLQEIEAIGSSVKTSIEAFVHGAICVCYSGQCYMSQAISGRSGNRGECMQPCRWDYDLTDGNGRKLMSKKHLLSVGDLNLSTHLKGLIDAGVTSFKIEGRLKDIAYLKNTVAYYRQELDALILKDKTLIRASLGETEFGFTPEPEKTFTRGFTDYYLMDRENKVSSFNTPKSIGGHLGRVKTVGKESFTIDTRETISGGDGICFMTTEGVLSGTNVNKAEAGRIFPNKMDGITPGTDIYRNYDHAFARGIEKTRTRRTIGLDAEVLASPERILIKLTAPDGISGEATVKGDFAMAENPAKSRETIINQASKTGDTIYRIGNIKLEGEDVFVPASVINKLRREAVEALSLKRSSFYQRETRMRPVGTVEWPEAELSYLGNVTNRLAAQFYADRGVADIEPGMEISGEYIGKAVMRTKYCLRRETNICLKNKGKTATEKLYIENNYNIFELAFDCEKCEMSIIYKGKKQ